VTVARVGAALLFALGSVAGAQLPPPASAAGVVRDSTGRPIEGAEISVGVARTRSDSLGKFSIRLQPTDSTTLTIRRVGFESLTFTMLTDSLARNDLDVELLWVPRLLPTVGVAEHAARVPTIDGFRQRKESKLFTGFYLSREDLQGMEHRRLSDFVRGMKGVIVDRGGGIRFVRHTGRTNCAPLYFLDGVPVRNMRLDDIPTSDVEGIELYASAASAPMEFEAFTPGLPCGIIVIWTRRPILRSP